MILIAAISATTLFNVAVTLSLPIYVYNKLYKKICYSRYISKYFKYIRFSHSKHCIIKGVVGVVSPFVGVGVLFMSGNKLYDDDSDPWSSLHVIVVIGAK